MRYFFLAVVLLGYVLPQRPTEPYPGQGQHAEPPKGWFCSNLDKRPAHKCECERMSQPSKEDPFCEEAPITEDPKCTVYCHKDHCHCQVKCKEHPGGEGSHE